MVIDPPLIIAALVGLFTVISSGGGAVIAYLVAQLKQRDKELVELRTEKDELNDASLAMARSAIAALDKLGGK